MEKKELSFLSDKLSPTMKTERGNESMKKGLQTVGGLSFLLLWGLAGASDQGAPLSQIVPIGIGLLALAIGSLLGAQRWGKKPEKRKACLSFRKKPQNISSLGA